MIRDNLEVLEKDRRRKKENELPDKEEEKEEKVEDEELERLTNKRLEEIITQKAKRASQPLEDRPIVMTDSNFYSVVSKHKIMVVDFWAPWCGPCRMVSPIIEQLAREYAGRVAFGKLNVDENPRTSNSFQIRSIPMMLVFKDGKAVDGILGAVPKAVIESKFRNHLSSERDSFYG